MVLERLFAFEISLSIKVAQNALFVRVRAKLPPLQ